MAQRLGIDSYSLRSQGWDAFQFLEYSAGLGLDNVHFSERRNFASLEPEYLRQLRARADALGVAIEVGMGSFERYAESFRAELGSGEEQLSQFVDAAVICGSPVVRCFLGAQTERRGARPFKEHLEEAVRTLKAVAPKARAAGVKIAVENHGGVDLLARELRWLIEEVGPESVGACLDTGNPAYGGEDPVLTTEILARYAVSSHVRDSAVWESDEGAFAQWTVMGQGCVDIRRILAILAEQAPDCPVDLEIITGGNPAPIPYLKPDSGHWRMYPDMLAQDFARFVALAKDGARRGLKAREQVILARGAEPTAALIRQQLDDFEQSVASRREQLGLGQRGR